jgi:hypothetical protein
VLVVGNTYDPGSARQISVHVAEELARDGCQVTGGLKAKHVRVYCRA